MPLSLEDYYGACSEKTCTALEQVVADRRIDRSDDRKSHVRRIADALERGTS